MMKVNYLLSKEITVSIEGKIILDKNTKFQHMQIIDTKDNRYLLLDKIIQLSRNDEHIYHESMVHPAMLASKSPRKILAIGGGDGGTIREILKYPVEEVILCELDREVIEMSKKYFPELSAGTFDDPRVKIVEEDGRKFLENSEEKFDVIIIDLTDPCGPSKLLFTKEFYELVKSSLTENGVMAMDGDTPYLKGLFPNLVKTVKTTFKDVYPYLVSIPSFFLKQGFIICSKSDISFMKDKRVVGELIDSKGLKLKHYNPNDLSGLFVTTKFIDDLLKGDYKVSTDKSPLEIDTYQVAKFG